MLGGSVGAGAPLLRGRWRGPRPAAPLLVVAKAKKGKQQAKPQPPKPAPQGFGTGKPTQQNLSTGAPAGKGFGAPKRSTHHEPGQPALVAMPDFAPEAQQSLPHPAPRLRSPVLHRPVSTQALAATEAYDASQPQPPELQPERCQQLAEAELARLVKGPWEVSTMPDYQLLLLQHVRDLLRLPGLPGVDPNAEALRVFRILASWLLRDKSNLLFLAYWHIGQLHMLYLAEASRQEGLSEEEAAYITAHLVLHSHSVWCMLLDAAALSRANPEGRDEFEIFALGATGAWVEAACAALTFLPQAPKQHTQALNEALPQFVRYLLHATEFSGDVPSGPAGVIKSQERAEGLNVFGYLPSAPTEVLEHILEAIEVLLQPPTGSAVEALKRSLPGRSAAVPLVEYARLKRQRGDPDADSFVIALAPRLSFLLLLRGLFKFDAQTAYRAVSTLLTAPGAGGAQASGGEGAQVPGGGLLDRFARWASRGSAEFLVSITMKAACKEFELAGADLPLRTQLQWELESRSIFGRAVACLQRGDNAGAAELIQGQLSLLEEPVLITPTLRPASWEELGGAALVDAAVAAGASRVLKALQVAFAAELGGPYPSPSVEQLLECHLRAGELEAAVELVERQAAAAAGLSSGGAASASASLWRLLGEACAAAGVGPEGGRLLPRLLSAALQLQQSSVGSFDGAPGGLLVLVRTVGELQSVCLPALIRHLVGDGSQAHESVRLAFQAMLDSGQQGPALQQLGELAAGRQLAGKKQARGVAEEEEGQAKLARALGALALGSFSTGEVQFCEAMSALSGRGAGPAAALLAKLCLEAENAPAAWRLLRCALPAACAARPETVLEVVNTLFRRRRFKEALAASMAVLGCQVADKALTLPIRRLAALAAANLGDAERALELAAGFNAQQLAEVAEALRELKQPLAPKVAAVLIPACTAAGRSATATHLYSQQLAAADSGAGLGGHVHAAALRAYLNEAQGDGQQAAGALETVLQLLQAREGALAGLRDVSLAAAVCSTAEALAKKAPPRRGLEEGCYIAAAGAVRGQDADASVLGCLSPMVQLALLGLRLAAATGGTKAARAQLPTAVDVAAVAGGSGQVLALLVLVPVWAGGVQPAAQHWAQVLSCALAEGALGDGARPPSALVLQQLGVVSDRLRATGPGWAEKLPTRAKLAALAVADATGNDAVALEAFEGLQRATDLQQEDGPLLNRCYSRLLAALFYPAGPADGIGQPQPAEAEGSAALDGVDMVLCARLADGWRRQLAAAKLRAVPGSVDAYEALAVARLLGLQEYRPGWKVLCEMAGQEVWGRPPSAQTLLLVLQGLAAQLGEGGPGLEDLLAFTQRVVADLAAATGTGSGSDMDESSSASAVGGPPALPPLDAQLAAAALQLLLAAGDAANDAGRGGGVLAAGVQVVMQALAAAQQPLSTELCEAVLAAFEADSSLEEWARQEFGAEAVDELEMQALGEGLGAPLVLRQLERRGAQESLGDGQEAPSPDGEEGEVDPAAKAAAERRAARVADARSIRTWEDLEEHLQRHGWELKRDKRHVVWALKEEGLQEQLFTHSCTTSDFRAIIKTRCTLVRVYQGMEKQRQLGNGQPAGTAAA